MKKLKAKVQNTNEIGVFFKRNVYSPEKVWAAYQNNAELNSEIERRKKVWRII